MFNPHLSRLLLVVRYFYYLLSFLLLFIPIFLLSQHFLPKLSGRIRVWNDGGNKRGKGRNKGAEANAEIGVFLREVTLRRCETFLSSAGVK